MVWEHSIHGVPWTPKKMRIAVEALRADASVGFAFGADKLAHLSELDDKVFARRPDLRLHPWSTRSSRLISEEELALLASMKQSIPSSAPIASSFWQKSRA